MTNLKGNFITTSGFRGYAIHYWDSGCPDMPQLEYANMYDSLEEARARGHRWYLCQRCASYLSKNGLIP